MQTSPGRFFRQPDVVSVAFATQSHGVLGVKFDTQHAEKRWHDFAAAFPRSDLAEDVFDQVFSRYYTPMLFRRFFILLTSVAASSLACHPKFPDPALGDPQGEISVRVINRNRIDVMVYVSHDGVRSRLGLATASTTANFTLPLRMLGAGREYQLIGDPLGLSTTISTETLFGQAGDEVTWQLEDRFTQSTVVVH